MVRGVDGEVIDSFGEQDRRLTTTSPPTVNERDTTPSTAKVSSTTDERVMASPTAKVASTIHDVANDREED